MASVDARWEGLDEALAKMRGLVPKLRKSGFRRAGTKAMVPVRDKARQGASRLDDPATASNISKNIITRNGSRRDERRYGGDAIVTKVGVAGGARAYKNNRKNQRSGRAGQSYAVDDPATFHWRFLEFGTRKMAARPFMRPALEQNVSKVITIYSSSLSKAIDDAIKADTKATARRVARLAGQ